MIPQYTGALATISKEHPLIGRAMCMHTSTRGAPMMFADKPYLIEFYTDARLVDNWCVMKGVQTGISEWAVQFMFDASGWRGRISAYVLPTFKVRNRFVQNRVNGLMLRVPGYRERLPGGEIGEQKQGGGGNLTSKRFGKGGILFLGSGTENDFVEFSADVMIVDEYDRCNAANLAMAADRLRASPYPQRLYISNPTLPRVGISKMFDESDRRRWHMQCDKCGERQAVDWFLNVVEKDDAGRWRLRDKDWRAHGRPRPICLRCRKPFERVVKGAAWIAENPDRPNRGYHMSRMDVLSEDLLDLFTEFRLANSSPDAMRTFFRSVLGKPYEFEGTQITVAQLEGSLLRDVPMDRMGGDKYRKVVVSAGVDVGSVLHVNVSIVERDEDERPIRHARLVCTVQTFEEVADIFRRFKVDKAVVDAMPEIHKAQELRDTFIDEGGTEVWLCRFHPTPRVGHQKYGMRLNYRARVIQVDRTSVFDVTYADIEEGRRFFPAETLGVDGWADQMRAPVRVVDREKQRIRWTEGNAADHFRLADIYDRIAVDLLEESGGYFVS